MCFQLFLNCDLGACKVIQLCYADTKKNYSSKYIMVVPEQSYRGTHDILTESLSLLITHHNIFCVTDLTNEKSLASTDFPTVRNKEKIMK